MSVVPSTYVAVRMSVCICSAQHGRYGEGYDAAMKMPGERYTTCLQVVIYYGKKGTHKCERASAAQSARKRRATRVRARFVLRVRMSARESARDVARA